MAGNKNSVKTCEFFLCLGIIVCVLYIVSELFVVLLVLCFKSLVSLTDFYTEDEPKFRFGKCYKLSSYNPGQKG